MILQDSADALLSILYNNPDKIDRRVLNKFKLRAELFAFDKPSELLFKIISLASYADKKVNDTFIEAFANRNKISEDLVEDIKFAKERLSEQDGDFALLEETVQVFKAELKTTLFKRLLLASNDELNKGKTQIDDLLLEVRQKLQDISVDGSDSSISTTRGLTSKFIEEYTREVSEDALSYGIKPLDDSIGLIMPGELHTIAGASGEGKSMVLANVIYHNLMQKKNLVLCSLEMSKTQVLYRLISLHSTSPKFGYNIPHEKIKKKTLSESEKSQFFEVAQDFFECDDYGELFFTEGASTAEELFEEAEDINKFVKVDGVFIDYISLLEGKGSSDQAKIANNFKLIKHYALTFSNNSKVPVITVHQISEQAKEKAEETGYYQFNFLADTSEVRKSSDTVSWIIRTEAHKESHEIGMGVAKVRDGEAPPRFSLFEQFEFSKIQAIDSTIE